MTTQAVDQPFVDGEPDRMVLATMTVLRRNVVPFSVVEPWVARIAGGALRAGRDGHPYPSTFNAEAFLRSLYLQLALAPGAPEMRSDLLLEVVAALKATNPTYLT